MNCVNCTIDMSNHIPISKDSTSFCYFNKLLDHMLRNKKLVTVSVVAISVAVIFNELLLNELFLNQHYFSQCKWPQKFTNPLKAILIADTHLVGPIGGYWFDVVLRDWQMERAYKTAISLHQPDIVFILGDLFEDGEYVDGQHYQNYLKRFHRTFETPNDIKVFSAVGNHDIGFHYSLTPSYLHRFEKTFTESANTLITIKETHFILLNSVTLERDGCSMCEEAEANIRNISKRLNCAKENSNGSDCQSISDKLPFYSRPILLQHFPTYRQSDDDCEEHDSYEVEINKESWDVLSRNATDFLGEQLDPNVVFCGHTHHYCRSYNKWGIEEYTVASFNRRQKRNPSFLLVEFSGEKYAVTKCSMPSRTTAVAIYMISALIVVTFAYYVKCYKHTRRFKWERSRRSNHFAI